MGRRGRVKQAFESYGRLRREVKSDRPKRCQNRLGL